MCFSSILMMIASSIITLADEKHLDVTLADEARAGVKEEVRSGFLDWLHQFSLLGEDGEYYYVGGSILSLNQEKIDVISLNWTKGHGPVVQLPNSIYKIADFPGKEHFRRMYREPYGTLKISQDKEKVIVECGEAYKVTCWKDHSWHLEVRSKDNEYQADLWHRPQGKPLWYGKTVPSALTQHSITYGYNWAGDVEGWIWCGGDAEPVKVKGRGIRERYVAVDSSAAELGAWEDWGWIAFDQMHCSLYDMHAGMKDFSLFDLETGKHYASDGTLKVGKKSCDVLNIIHSDWAFLRELDGFIPEYYHITIKTEDGVFEADAHVANATTWGVTFQVPDNPVATLMFDKVSGTFTANDGTVRELSGGLGSMSIRQWHQYPNILPRELYTDPLPSGECESKFDTL
ncbi:MAG: hypothetical protein ACI3ZK_04025 [Candidatus Cryptobacteroides sp.]